MSNLNQSKEDLDAVLHWRGKHAVAIKERDAALGREKECQRQLGERWKDIEALRNTVESQSDRLTAADELEKALRRIARPHDCGCLPCHGDCISKLALEITVEEMRETARAALKPAEAAKCERCGCSTVETCDDRGCGYLGAGNGAPE